MLSQVQTRLPQKSYHWILNNSVLVLMVTVVAFLIRLPYWRTIPAAGDETGQATLAMRIAQGQKFPLTGTDAYTGPFFVYLMSGFYLIGFDDPFLGRVLMLLAGTLTATATYGLAYQLTGKKTPSLIASALVAANPHQVLLSSHPGAATFLMPFFVVLFIWATLIAYEADWPVFWGGASLMAGLALNANLVAIVPLLGVGVWFALITRRWQRLGKYWPLWPSVGIGIVIIVCLPLILYLVRSQLDTVNVLAARSYLWESKPTISTYAVNFPRLILQLLRQTGGVLTGQESLQDILGFPMLLVIWMATGLFATNRRLRSLLFVAVLPYLIIVPYFSAHYGILEPVRFTTYMTPLLACGMGMSADWVIQRLRQLTSKFRALRWGLYGGVTLLIALPLNSLASYYAHIEQNNLSGQVLYELASDMIRSSNDEKIYVAFSENFMLKLAGIPYVPEAYATAARRNFEFLPAEQIMGRLFTSPGPALLLLTDEDVTRIRQVAQLQEWPGAANQQARKLGYGLYRLDATIPLAKPDFVLTGEQAKKVAPQTLIHLQVGRLELIGYDLPEAARPGDVLKLRLYWRAQQPLPVNTYIGFVHLFAPDGTTLMSQSDRQLGQYLYPVNAWQSEEVIIDQPELSIPGTATAGTYIVRLGVYTWPSLQRLEIAGYPDNVFELKAITIGR